MKINVKRFIRPFSLVGFVSCNTDHVTIPRRFELLLRWLKRPRGSMKMSKFKRKYYSGYRHVTCIGKTERAICPRVNCICMQMTPALPLSVLQLTMLFNPESPSRWYLSLVWNKLTILTTKCEARVISSNEFIGPLQQVGCRNRVIYLSKKAPIFSWILISCDLENPKPQKILIE